MSDTNLDLRRTVFEGEVTRLISVYNNRTSLKLVSKYVMYISMHIYAWDKGFILVF